MRIAHRVSSHPKRHRAASSTCGRVSWHAVAHLYKDLEASLRTEAATRGLDLIVVACEMDPARQASQIEDFVAQKVSAILVAPCDSSAIVPHLKAAQQAGIPVFSADIAVNGSAVVSHIASDNVQGGRLAARALAELLNGKGKVLIIDHPEVASVRSHKF